MDSQIYDVIMPLALKDMDTVIINISFKGYEVVRFANEDI